ncbi:MAG TPA: DUF4382 domain-containing protein [Steroidobacteraceae bacterium]|nr:DUF4382 domain-containing protein [Steroidobacteraceae bacterium]
MSNMLRGRRHLPGLALLLLLGGALLAGCQSRTNVSATGNTPAQFTHVFLTITQIWFNTSASAAATDSSWQKFTLATPATVDLVSLNNGTLSQFASELKVAAGTYSQVIVVLADSTDTLTTSAQTAGAASNDEVDYVDTSNVAHTVPLAVLNAAQGIDISTSLTVAAAATGIGGIGGGSSPTSTSSTTTTTTTAFGTGSSPAAPSSSTFSTPTVSTTAAIVDFDASRDLLPISLSGQPAYALNPHPLSYDVAHSGTIQGAVSLAAVSTLTTAGSPDVQVSAETLSGDGTRHVIVKTTRVDASGNFTLYPLSTASGASSSYDLVIHGPNIETVIVKSVPVAAGTAGTTTAQLGTLTLTAATSFLVNFNTSSPAAPTSSLVGFYQTLPLSGEVPYLVETRAIDPVSGRFATDQSLSGGSLQYGSYVSGGTISLTSANPGQGAATYSIGAINTAYGAAALGTTVTSPGNTTTTALFTMSAPPLPTGSSANAIAGTVSLASRGTYDNAELFLTYHGVLVAAAPLNSYLGQSQSTLTLTAIAPGGTTDSLFAAGVYNAEVWAWNSANPTGTLSRSAYATTIDLSAGNASGVALNIQ